jgi:hypothetical protein
MRLTLLRPQDVLRRRGDSDDLGGELNPAALAAVVARKNASLASGTAAAVETRAGRTMVLPALWGAQTSQDARKLLSQSELPCSDGACNPASQLNLLTGGHAERMELGSAQCLSLSCDNAVDA